MILIVGHGPSANVKPKWIDGQDYVVRCDTATHRQSMKSVETPEGIIYRGRFRPHIGMKVDAVVTTQPKRSFTNADTWYEHVYRDTIREVSNRFVEARRRKLSTGTVACMVAKLIKFPDEEVGAVGFDTTLGGIYLPDNNWPYHDAEGEGKVLRHIGIKDFGNYG